MNAQTASALDVLEKADWFARLGVKDTETAQLLSSWQTAMKHCDSGSGRNFGLDAINQFGLLVRAKAEECFNRWNDVVRGLEPAVKTLVKKKIEKVIREHNLPQKPFELMVYKGILRTCIELEYRDIHPPGFFASLAWWYIRGHFPCGWKGVEYRQPQYDAAGFRKDAIDLYPPGFYDPIANWYENGDFGDWQGQIPPPGKLIVY